MLLIGVVSFCSGSVYASDFSIGPLDYEIVSVKDRIVKPIALNKEVEYLEIPFKVEYEGCVFFTPTLGHITNSEIFADYIGKVKQVVLHEGIESLDDTFGWFSSLVKINFPSTLHTLGSTFHDCTSLESITLPDNISSITGPIFKGCSNLKDVNFEGNPQFISGKYPTSGVFQDCISLETITLPESIKCIGRDFFSGCKQIKNVMLPSSCLSIAANCFENCSSLTSIEFPKSLISIEDWAFKDSGLSGEIILPNNIRYIGQDAFRNCKLIENFTFPDNCALMVDIRALYGCENLTSISIPNNGGKFKGIITDSPVLKEVISLNNFAPEVDSDFLPNSSFLKAKLIIRKSALSSYADSETWGNFINIETIYDELPNHDVFFNFEIPREYEDLFNIYYPERHIAVMEGNSAKINVTYTRAGYSDSHSEFVPYFNNIEIVKSATIEDFGTSYKLEPYEYSQRFFITPPIYDTMEFAIRHENSSSVENILEDNTEGVEDEIYSINGIRLNCEKTNLPKGVYIIRKGKKTFKLLVR